MCTPIRISWSRTQGLKGTFYAPSKLKRSHIYSHMMLCDVNPSRDGLVSAGRAVGTGRLHKLHFPSFKGDNPNKL